jgi:putative spermidine/putrescine transport system permease protein
MVLVFSLGFFVTPAILGGGRVVMVAEYVFIQITQTSRWGFASAIAVLLFALVGALLLVLLRINRSGRGVVG